MKFKSFSETQLKALSWWSDSSPYRDYDAVICDGAVRSGKTMCMGISFVCWAMRRFSGERFGICGKAKTSIRRNLLEPLLPVLRDIGFCVSDKVSRGLVEISYMGRTNSFYLFGGKDEGSQSLIQGVTLAGILMDEVVLMPRSFVEQACARCSVTGSKIWFNCNPDSPHHWFYREWIVKATERKALYIHFSLEDNPALSRSIIARYKRTYSGDFYRRFILGQWVIPAGRVYDFFDESMLCEVPENCTEQMLGSRGQLRIGLDIYSPSPNCDLLKEQICAYMGSVSSLTVTDFEAGEVSYDGETEMYRCECTVGAKACLVRQLSDPEGNFELEEG